MPSDDAKAVKKEEVEDEDEINLGSLRKKKPSIATPKEAKAKKVKKEEVDEDFEQPSSKKSSTKPSVKVQKKKKKEEDEKKKKKKGAKQPEKIANKRERKVYDLPGQKRDPPEERDPLRIFYESLYKQVPNSEMAAIWMMESGLLAKDVAKKVFEKKQKKALKTPMTAVVTVKKKTQSVTIKKKTQSVTNKKKTSSSPISTQKKKTPDSKVPSKQSKKRKMADSSSDEASDDDDDFVLESKRAKKQRAA